MVRNPYKLVRHPPNFDPHRGLVVAGIVSGFVSHIGAGGQIISCYLGNTVVQEIYEQHSNVLAW